jgi:uncharacterized membrane protein
MLVVILCILTALLLFQLWWAIACVNAYRQTNDFVYLIQVAQGCFAVIFFASLIAIYGFQSIINPSSPFVLLVLILITSILWRVKGGPTAMAKDYPRGLIDIIQLRRPSVDLKRRVRGR